MRIFRIAAAKDKLKGKYKSITDPFVILFVYNYENIIPWADINPETATEDINNYVNNTLLPQIYSKMEKNTQDNNYYKGDFNVELELQLDPNNDDLKRAYEMYQQNPQRGQEYLRERVNEEKGKTFQKWQHNLKTDPVYSAKPTFMYALLEKMLKESPSNEQNRPTSSRMPAIHEVYRAINSQSINPNQQLNIWKIYKDKVGDILFADIKHTDKDGSGWKLIPSKDRDPKNFKENKETLMDLSVGHGWCIGKSEGIADDYLGDGDFWMYIENVKNRKKPQVAIRMYRGKTAEIRARHNKPADSYAEQVFDLYEVEKLDMTGGGTYQYGGGESSFITHLKTVYDGVNKKLESGKITWKDITYSMYLQLSKTNEERMPEEERERIAREFIAKGINITTTIPPAFEKYDFVKNAQSQAWLSELSKNPSIYETIRFPAELKDREDVKAIRLTAWAERIARDETLLEKAPSDIMNNPAIYEKVVDGIVLKVTANPLEYNNVSMAMRRGQQRIIDLAQTVVIPVMAEKIKKNPTYYDKVPYEFVRDNRVKDAFKEGYLKVIKTDPRYLNGDICRSSWALDLVKEIKKSKEIKDILDKKNKPQEQPIKSEVKETKPTQQPPIDPNVVASKKNRLVCSSCNEKIEKISKSVNTNEEIYYCPCCENMGTLDEI